MKIGAQLFTLRDYCANLDDFAKTLDRVADIGYTAVQVSGTCAYEADWLAEQLKRTGLTCDLTHFNLDRIRTETDQVVKEHNTFGCKYIGVGSMPNDYRGSVEGLERFVKDVSPAAKRIKELGSTHYGSDETVYLGFNPKKINVFENESQMLIKYCV